MFSNKILAISSSRVGNSGYLETATPLIKSFLGSKAIKIAFLPFASVETNYEEYTFRVKKAFSNLPYLIDTVLPGNAKNVIAKSDAIMTGGGNTFKLLHDIYQLDIFEVILKKVNSGTPYIGWSAGANVTGLTIGTTNDMPIIQPQSFNAFGFFPFQINPHYINQKKKGFNGETRDERLKEFMILNPGISIVGLPEGTALQLSENDLKFIGEKTGVLFHQRDNSGHFFRKIISPMDDLSFLL